jgi:hypothetical protein
VPETAPPSFVEWSSFPFEGELRVKKLDEPVAVEPPRKGEEKAECAKCRTPDDSYIWVNENWRVRSLERPSGLPMVLILESRSHLDLGDLPNMLAAELGVMTVRLERAIRSLDGVARVHVNRWGDGAAHLHLWFMARPYGRLQLRGTFLTLWDEILPPIPEPQWRENLALVAAWLAEFGGEPLAKPPRIDWKAPSSFEQLIQTAGESDPDPPASTEPDPADPPAAEPDSAAEPRVAGQPAPAQPSSGQPAPAQPPSGQPAPAQPGSRLEPELAPAPRRRPPTGPPRPIATDPASADRSWPEALAG